MSNTLLLSSRFDIDSKMMKKAAENAGWKVERIFNYDYKPSPGEKVYVFGQILFCDIMADKLGLNLVDCPLDFIQNLPEYYRKRKVENMKAKEAHNWPMYKTFVKPARSKNFEARVYDNGELVTFPDLEEEIIIQEPVHYELEVRSFVLDQQIQELSPYMVNMEPIEILVPEDTYTTRACVALGDERFITLMEDFPVFASAFLENITLPKTCVVDFGYIPGKGWVVIELNNTHSSGLYDCFPEAVLECLEATR